MGGNAIKSAQRLTKAQFIKYGNELKKLFPELKMEIVKAYRQKEDFGDIDIVVQTIPNLNIKQLVKDRINPSDFYDNNMFFSFLYKTAQVDFIFMSENEFDAAYNYFCWNDLMNFMGRTARSLNFKLGHDGLSFEKHLSDNYKLTVHVSSDMEKILPFLGYDYETWLNGFDTTEEIFAYAASSKYFNSLYFSLEHQANTDRVRNKKRKMYQLMLKYIEDNNLPVKPKLDEHERNQILGRATVYFGDKFLMEIARKEREFETNCIFKQHFNGDIVKELLPLTDKSLGAFMSYFREQHPDLKTDVITWTKEQLDSAIFNSYYIWLESNADLSIGR